MTRCFFKSCIDWIEAQLLTATVRFDGSESESMTKTISSVSRRRLFQSGAVMAAGAALGSRIPAALALEAPQTNGLDALARDLFLPALSGQAEAAA